MNKLLIVDNSIRLVEIMKKILERCGYNVKTLTSITNIYEEISAFQPDLVILDIFLNGEDGRDICKKIKMNHETKHLPVILFSAFTKALEDYKNYFADDFIEKPFDIKVLFNKITSLLRRTSIPANAL